MDKILYPAIFLDRDGVINEAIVKDGQPYPPRDKTEFQFCENIEGLMDFFSKQNFKVFTPLQKLHELNSIFKFNNIFCIILDIRSKLNLIR